MNAAEIIEYLKERNLTVRLTDDDSLELEPAEKITHELIERLRKHKPAIIEELKREQRREKVLRMLEDNPGIRRSFMTDAESDPDHVIIALAIRDAGTCELLIPRHKYDPFLLFELFEKGSLQ